MSELLYYKGPLSEAKSIVAKMNKHIGDYESAKKCAIISCEQILKLHKTGSGVAPLFWKEVIKEIEDL